MSNAVFDADSFGIKIITIRVGGGGAATKRCLKSCLVGLFIVRAFVEESTSSVTEKSSYRDNSRNMHL